MEGRPGSCKYKYLDFLLHDKTWTPKTDHQSKLYNIPSFERDYCSSLQSLLSVRGLCPILPALQFVNKSIRVHILRSISCVPLCNRKSLSPQNWRPVPISSPPIAPYDITMCHCMRTVRCIQIKYGLLEAFIAKYMSK